MSRSILLAGAALVLLPVAAAAQTGPATNTSDQTAASGTASDQAGVGDIVVTAERRSSTAQRTPAAITALSGDEIRERQLTTIGDVLVQTPAVVIQNSTKGQAVFIRGIGSTGDAQEGGDPAVNLNIDGVYEQQAIVPLANSFDINRVEVLRGPQGTLYGRNSNAGSINIITNDPILGQTSGYASAEYGNYNQVRGEGALNFAVADDVAARVAFVGNRHDGFYSNGGDSADGFAIRAKVKAKPTDRLTLSLAGLYAQETGSPAATVPAPLNTSDPYNTTFPAYNGMNGNPFFPPLAAAPTVIPRGVQNTKFIQVYGQADYDLDFATLTVQPAYTHTFQYQDSVLLPFGAAAQKGIEDAGSLEARLASRPSSPITWLVGLYGYAADDHRDPFAATTLNFVHAPVALPSDQAVLYGTRSYAGFGQVTVPITPAFRLTGGARYTHDRKETDFDTYTSSTASTPGPKYTNSYSRATFKGGGEFDVADNALFYAQVSSGFKAGGVNPNSSTYAPEAIIAYEAGLKTRFFDNKVQLNVSIYDYHYTGYQARVNAPDCTISTGFSQQTINAATLNNHGGEAELTVAPTRHDRLYASASYLHAKGRFLYDNGICSAGVITHDYLDVTQAPPNAPSWSGLVGYEHRFDFAGGYSLSARADLRWSSSYLTSIDISPYNLQGSFTRTDAAVVFSLPGDRISIRGYVRNIENKAQILFTLAPPIPFAALELSDPRTFGLAIMAKF